MQRPQHSQPPAGDQVYTYDNFPPHQILTQLGKILRKCLIDDNINILPKGVDPREAGQSGCQPETRPSQRATESGSQGKILHI